MSQNRTGSIYVREPDKMLPTGEVIDGHAHTFDHTTFFVTGLWLVSCEVDGKEFKQKVEGGHPGSRLLIRANIKHRLEVLRGPACYACVYSHRTPDGEVVEEYTGWHGAYGVVE